MNYKGLSEKQAQENLQKYGKNQLEAVKKVSVLKLFISQFTSPLLLILITTVFISFGINYFKGEGNYLEPIFILLIVIISGVAGFLQEYKAEKTIEALQKISTPKIKVIRDWKVKIIDVSLVTIGDIVILNEGDIVPADCEILESFNLKIDESILTGESEDVYKTKGDKCYAKTLVKEGKAFAKVYAIGMQTEIGKLSQKLQEIEETKSGFQIEIEKLSKALLYIIIFIASLIFIISLIKYDIITSLLTSISLAVAAIPEGLTAILTLSLSIGARAMAKKNAVVRKLSAIETLGSVDVICSDKTGTITKDEMEVKGIFLPFKTLYKGEFSREDAEKILLAGALCNDVDIITTKDGENLLGDETEKAILKLSEEFDFKKQELLKEYKRIDEIPFSSDRKMMSVVVENNVKKYVFSKGATEIILSKCSKILIDGDIRKLTQQEKEKVIKGKEEISNKGYRVLAFAFKEIVKENENYEESLVFLGLEFMLDAPKENVKEAVKFCKTAGIRVIMITGDDPLTAKAVANIVGIETEEIITGTQLDKLSDKELEQKLKEGVNVFARISPFHKLKILEVLQKNYRVAMTGDGINDALSLKKADVGVVMGKKGTEVSKQASDIVLLDDNFATIVEAIKEGRRIFANIRKFINYLLTSNFAEVLVIFLVLMLFSLKTPAMLPLQILWINLLTDGLPAIALGLDPAEKNIMQKPPRKRDEGIIDNITKLTIVLIGLKKVFMLLSVFFIILMLFGEEQARSALFMGFVLYEFVRIGVIRSQEKLGWFSNKILIISLLLSFVLQILAIYSPLNKVFNVEPMNVYSWIILVIGASIGYYLAMKIPKYIIKLSEKENEFLSKMYKIIKIERV